MLDLDLAAPGYTGTVHVAAWTSLRERAKYWLRGRAHDLPDMLGVTSSWFTRPTGTHRRRNLTLTSFAASPATRPCPTRPTERRREPLSEQPGKRVIFVEKPDSVGVGA